MEQENVNAPLTYVCSDLCNINVETQIIMINLGNSYPECHWFESDRRYHIERPLPNGRGRFFVRERGVDAALFNRFTRFAA